SSLLRGLWMPGVSIKTNCTGPFVTLPIMRMRVVWGYWVTMATFSPTRRLVRLDLPTLGLPTSATNTLLVRAGSFGFVVMGQTLLFGCPAKAEHKQIGQDQRHGKNDPIQRAGGQVRPQP